MFSTIDRMRDLVEEFRALPVPERFAAFAAELDQVFTHTIAAMDEVEDIVDNALNNRYDDFDEYGVEMKAAGDARERAGEILFEMGISQ
jgi:hypothetical protein